MNHHHKESQFYFYQSLINAQGNIAMDKIPKIEVSNFNTRYLSKILNCIIDCITRIWQRSKMPHVEKVPTQILTIFDTANVYGTKKKYFYVFDCKVLL